MQVYITRNSNKDNLRIIFLKYFEKNLKKVLTKGFKGVNIPEALRKT